MSKASRQADARAEPWIDRLQPWIGGFSSALLHLLLLFLALSSSQVTVTTPQGAAAGSRMAVTFIDKADQPPPASTESTRPPEPKPKPAQKAPAASRVQSTQVTQAEDPVPPAAPSTPQAAPTPPDVPDDVWQDVAQARAASPPETTQRRPWTWGRPPGMLQEDLAPVNAGPARSPAIEQGRRNHATAAEPNLEVDGYQVYYDLRNENRLRTWRDQGMTELFLPLPGTRKYMVCPLEIALRRGSGPCRLVEPDAPEMAFIGDAREAITMQQVYRRGELVWRGPGPYR